MIITSEVALVDGKLEPRFAVRVEDGAIVAAGPVAELAQPDEAMPKETIVDLGRRAMLPGTVNAHNHSFQSLLRGLGDDLGFMGWRDRVLYPCSRRLDARGIGLGAAFAFAEMLRHGITTVVDFF